MTTEAERAAEECSQKWAITAIKPVGQPLYDLPSDVIKDIKYRLKQAFLAGHAHALRPRKIILDQPDTYPPSGKQIALCDSEQPRWYTTTIESEDDLEDALRALFKEGYVYWYPLPPTPQGEGE